MPVALLFYALFAISKIAWLTPTSHDFGEILRGESKTHIFEFRNISDAPLLIDNVRTECGCTSSDWEETPVEAGKIGKITITYDASKAGYFKKKIIVWMKGQKSSEKLWIEGEVSSEK